MVFTTNSTQPLGGSRARWFPGAALRLAGAVLLSCTGLAGGCAGPPEEPAKPAVPPSLTGEEAVRYRLFLDMAYRMYREEAYDLALNSLEAAREIRAEDPRLNLYLGHTLRKLKRLVPAEEALRRGLVAAPDRPELEFQLGLVYFDQFRFDRAVEQFRKVLDTDPSQHEAIYYLGLAEYRRNRPEAAVIEFEKLLGEDARFPEANYSLGRAFFQIGRIPAAIRSFQEELRLNPDHPASHFNLAKAFRAQGREEEAREEEARFHLLAEAEYRRVQETRQIAIHADQGRMSYDQGDFLRAVEEFQAVLAVRGDDPQILTYLGSTYLALNQLDRAEATLNRSLALRASDGFALTELGRVHVLRGDPVQGEEVFREAIQSNPYLSLPHYFLAILLRSLGRQPESDEEMKSFHLLESGSGHRQEGWLQ